VGNVCQSGSVNTACYNAFVKASASSVGPISDCRLHSQASVTDSCNGKDSFTGSSWATALSGSGAGGYQVIHDQCGDNCIGDFSVLTVSR